MTTLEDTVSPAVAHVAQHMLGELTSTAHQAGSALQPLVAKTCPAPTRRVVHLCEMLFNCQLHGRITTPKQKLFFYGMPQVMATPIRSSV